MNKELIEAMRLAEVAYANMCLKAVEHTKTPTQAVTVVATFNNRVTNKFMTAVQQSAEATMKGGAK